MSVGYMPTITAELVSAAQLGDHAAIVALLEATQKDIRRYASRSCRREDVDDAVQEALTIVAARIAALRAPAAFISWLLVIVARECYRLGRRGLRVWEPLESVENAIGIASRPDAELRYDLGMAIQSLPPNLRTLVIMRDLDGRSIEEIATALDTTRETVKARLRRARTLLQEYLAD